MKLSSLDALLSKQLSPAAFKDMIAADMAEYLKNASIKGAVMPVRVTEDKDIELSSAHINVLCELFVNKQLSPEELAFIADAMQLSERVDVEEGLADLVAEMTYPEINGAFTMGRAQEILRNV